MGCHFSIAWIYFHLLLLFISIFPLKSFQHPYLTSLSRQHVSKGSPVFRLQANNPNKSPNAVERVLQQRRPSSHLTGVNSEKNLTIIGNEMKMAQKEDNKVLFPELEQSGIDEKALRASPFGKVLFAVLDRLFPVFSEPNWFDVYDPPLTTEENLALPFFDGYDFANSSWTIYVRHRFGAWNWLDRMGLVPQATQRVFLRPDGKTCWSDGYYGDWYINPAINYFQIEKHFGRGFGYTQYHRGIRVYQIQRWHYEDSIGRYWQRGLRSYLRNETQFWAFEGRVWGSAVKWRPYPRDQGKFLAIRDGANLTEIFGRLQDTPWQARFEHAMSLPFYQAHPDQLERIEDNFDFYYRNLLGSEIR
eukprot:scaffold1594_cov171-Ochromonas_danica.AAC.14